MLGSNGIFEPIDAQGKCSVARSPHLYVLEAAEDEVLHQLTSDATSADDEHSS